MAESPKSSKSAGEEVMTAVYSTGSADEPRVPGTEADWLSATPMINEDAPIQVVTVGPGVDLAGMTSNTNQPTVVLQAPQNAGPQLAPGTYQAILGEGGQITLMLQSPAAPAQQEQAADASSAPGTPAAAAAGSLDVGAMVKKATAASAAKEAPPAWVPPTSAAERQMVNRLAAQETFAETRPRFHQMMQTQQNQQAREQVEQPRGAPQERTERSNPWQQDLQRPGPNAAPANAAPANAAPTRKSGNPWEQASPGAGARPGPQGPAQQMPTAQAYPVADANILGPGEHLNLAAISGRPAKRSPMSGPPTPSGRAPTTLGPAGLPMSMGRNDSEPLQFALRAVEMTQILQRMGTTWFELHVFTQENEHWVVYRRYEDFENLHLKMQMICAELCLKYKVEAQFPRTHMFGCTGVKLEKRYALLQQWLQTVLRHPLSGSMWQHRIAKFLSKGAVPQQPIGPMRPAAPEQRCMKCYAKMDPSANVKAKHDSWGWSWKPCEYPCLKCNKLIGPDDEDAACCNVCRAFQHEFGCDVGEKRPNRHQEPTAPPAAAGYPTVQGYPAPDTFGAVPGQVAPPTRGPSGPSGPGWGGAGRNFGAGAQASPAMAYPAGPSPAMDYPTGPAGPAAPEPPLLTIESMGPTSPAGQHMRGAPPGQMCGSPTGRNFSMANGGYGGQQMGPPRGQPMGPPRGQPMGPPMGQPMGPPMGSHMGPRGPHMGPPVDPGMAHVLAGGTGHSYGAPPPYPQQPQQPPYHPAQQPQQPPYHPAQQPPQPQPPTPQGGQPTLPGGLTIATF